MKWKTKLGKVSKRLFSLFLAVILVGGGINLPSSMNVQAAEEAEGTETEPDVDTDTDVSTPTASGSFGEEIENALMWSFYEGDGLLSITGSGAMPDFTEDAEKPWKEYMDQITAIQIESGITGVGAYAFAAHTKVESVQFPTSLGKIGAYAFSGCASLNTGLWISQRSIRTAGWYSLSAMG